MIDSNIYQRLKDILGYQREVGDKVHIGGIIGDIVEVLEGSYIIRLYDGAKIQAQKHHVRKL